MDIGLQTLDNGHIQCITYYESGTPRQHPAPNTKKKMKTTLYAIGKTDDDYLNTGIGKYCQRIVRYTPFEFVTLPDIRNSKSMSEAVQRTKEGELIIKQLDNGDYVVLLDERGREMTSVGMAEWMGGVFAQGHKRLVSGAYGKRNLWLWHRV